MNQSDNSSPKIEITCVESVYVHRIATEQLRLWISDRRISLHASRRNLLKLVDILEKEITSCDQLLADLTNS